MSGVDPIFRILLHRAEAGCDESVSLLRGSEDFLRYPSQSDGLCACVPQSMPRKSWENKLVVDLSLGGS
jgi:hypothetical protein